MEKILFFLVFLYCFYMNKHNIQMGKIEIPSNFNGKIPEYTKEKQEELKDFRNMVIYFLQEVQLYIIYF